MAEQVKASQTSDAAVTALQNTASELYKKYATKSAVIRELASRNHTKGEIAKALGIRYQHVYNVLKQELKGGSKNQPPKATETVPTEVKAPTK